MRSVADKKDLPPSGDKHDYVSLSPYWWPNPDTPDGLPYIRKDGEFNPERDQYDVSKLDTFGKTVTRLSFAYYYTGDERYAEAAVKRLDHFLLDPETRMRPRMQYGQFIPGVNNGRKYGIIETLRLRWVPDAVEMLAGSEALTPEVLAGVRGWFGDYATWLNTSEFGVAERDGDNNHATWAKAQIANYSAFAGDLDTTREMVEMARERLTDQFEPDGTQPEELARTRALDYSDFNLRGYSDLATLGADAVDVDLWDYVADDGTSLRKGYDFVLPFITEEKEFPYQQIKKRKHDRYAEMLRRAAIAYNEPAFEAAIETLTITDETRMQLDLMWPLPAVFPAALRPTDDGPPSRPENGRRRLFTVSLTTPSPCKLSNSAAPAFRSPVLPLAACPPWPTPPTTGWRTSRRSPRSARALDHGINFFDTAPGYGDGASEELLGRALEGVRDQAVIANKISSQTMDADEVRTECEKSLKRLRTDVMDLYQVHWPQGRGADRRDA